jgi:hypothetical protein
MTRAERRAIVTVAALALMASACGTDVPDDALAVWRGGFVTGADLDEHLLSVPAGRRVPPPGADRGDWLADRVTELFVIRVVTDPERLDDARTRPEFADEVERRTRSRLAQVYRLGHDTELTVTLEAAEAYFAAHRDDFVVPERRSFRTLLVSFPDGADATTRREVRKEAEELRRQALSGASFEALVREHSASATAAAGGLVGAVTRDQLRGEAARVVFSLEPGEVSPVIETPAGCNLIQLVGVQPASDTGFEAHKFAVLEHLAELERNRYFAELVRDEAMEQGVELVEWPEQGIPEGAEPGTVLVDRGSAPVTVADVVRAARSGGDDLATTYLKLVGERLLAESIRSTEPERAAEIEREVADAVALRIAGEVAFTDWVASLPEQRRRDFFDAHRGLFMADPQVELSVFEWPIEPGDPTLELPELRRFAAALASDSDAALELWREAEAAGAERRLIPLSGLRALGAAEPLLAARLPDQPDEGQVVGPFRVGDRLAVIEVLSATPSRPLAYEEVAHRVPDVMLQVEPGSLRREWTGHLAERLGLEIRRERLAAFGESIVPAASKAPAE